MNPGNRRGRGDRPDRNRGNRNDRNNRGGRHERHDRHDRSGRRPEKNDPPDFWERLLGAPTEDNEFLEKTGCPACGNLSARIKRRLGPTLLKECRDCRLIYISPRLSESVRDQMYRRNPGRLESEKNLVLRHLMAERVQNMLREMFPIEGVSKATATLLEVGSGWGHFLQLCRPHYRSVEGLELSRDQAAHARERFDVEVSSVDIMRDPWPKQHHLIAAWELIEHLPHPLQFLQWAHDHLLPGGQLMLSTPNYDSLFRRLLGPRWFYFIPSQHLVYFTPASLKDLLHKAGFAEVSIHTSGRSLLRERFNGHNKVDRSASARDQWLQTLRTRDAIEQQRERTELDLANPVKKLWNGVAWHLLNPFVSGGMGDQMRVYARKS